VPVREIAPVYELPTAGAFAVMPLPVKKLTARSIDTQSKLGPLLER
jgi:hypothetical protein